MTDTQERLVGAPLIDRLWFRTEVVGECWLSGRAPTRRVRVGEGENTYRGIRVGDRMIPVHQAGWLALRGKLGVEMELHHLCGNKPCWRPEHLQPMTPQDHARLHSKAVCKHGHALTSDNIYVRPTPKVGWSGRECLTCRRDRNRVKNAKRSAERAAKRALR